MTEENQFNHTFGDSVVEEWVHDGRECIVTKHPSVGYYCGYARTTLLDLSHGVTSKYNPNNSIRLIEVNGGLTYGPDDDGFVGFDCGHSWDVCWTEDDEPHDTFAIDDENRRDWYKEDVVEEVEYLADQLTLLERFVDVNG